MNKNYLLGFAFLFILVFIGMASATLNVSLSDQGTEVTNTTSGALLSSGDLIVTIYDALTGGNLIYTETFSGAIGNGTWNVMLGEIVNLPLEFGRIYYKDYSIAGEDASFVNGTGQTVGRQFFYSPLGDINSSKVFGAFTGASNTTNGTTGIVLAPQAGEQDKCLRGDGTWGSCATSGDLEYIMLGLSANQINISDGATIIFNDTISSSGLTVDSAGQVTLTGGKTYLLQASVFAFHTATFRVSYSWYSDIDGEIGKDGKTSSHGFAPASDETASSLPATIIYTPSSTAVVNVTATVGWIGAVDAGISESWATIIEIGVGASDNSTGGGAFYGSLKWDETTNCLWTTTSSTFVNIGSDAECDDNARTARGLTTSITTVGNAEGQVPQIKFDSLPAGYYFVRATGFYYSNNSESCYWRFTDGNQNTTSNTIGGGAQFAAGGTVEGEFFFTSDQGATTLTLQAARQTANACELSVAVGDGHREFEIAVYYFPSFGTAKSDTVFSDLDGDTRINVDGDGSDSDNMTFFTAGIERMRIDSNGFTSAKGFNNQMMRANDSVFETATNGTEYFSHNQYGGFYGTVFIKFFNFNVIAGGSTEQIAHGVTGISRMISLIGSAQITNGDFIPIPHASTQATPNVWQVMPRITGSNIEILSGSSRVTPNFRIENGTIRFEYTK